MSMEAPVDGELIDLEESGVRVFVVARGRRGPGTDSVLRRLVAGSAGVPADDVELVHACAVCGARHGRPAVAYPATPSGGAWFADAAVSGDAIVAAAGTRHPVGVGIESAVAGFDEVIDEAAFHASELSALAELDPARRPLVRAALWARKSALLRAMGHTAFIEPSTLAVSLPGDDDGVGRVERSVPEFGPGWRDIRFHDVPVPGNRAASVAVLG
jgi:4'-phosphopantetheinyl transferase